MGYQNVQKTHQGQLFWHYLSERSNYTVLNSHQPRDLLTKLEYNQPEKHRIEVKRRQELVTYRYRKSTKYTVA